MRVAALPGIGGFLVLHVLLCILLRHSELVPMRQQVIERLVLGIG